MAAAPGRIAPDEPRLDAFHLQAMGDGRFRVPGVGSSSVEDVVFGGLVLAQLVLATAATRSAEHVEPGHIKSKHIKSLHTIFARSARTGSPLDLAVETIHDGRAMASMHASVGQGGRVCAQSLVLLDVDEPDLVHHQLAAPIVGAPSEAPTGWGGLLAPPGSEVRVVGGTDTWSASAPVGPPELDVWVRLPAAPPSDRPGRDVDGSDRRAWSQAMLAHASVGFLIGTALRPHAGLGQQMAHRELTTGVVTHTITFHRPWAAGQWLLLAHTSPYAGRGGAYGRADVFSEDGTLVASFVQDSVIRRQQPS